MGQWSWESVIRRLFGMVHTFWGMGAKGYMHIQLALAARRIMYISRIGAEKLKHIHWVLNGLPT